MKSTSILAQTLMLALGIVIAAGIANVFGLSIPLHVTNTTQTAELSVVGEGKVEVVPDKANVDVGVNVENAATVDAAQKQLNDTNNAIVTAMAKLGVDKKDIKTGNYSIYPNYSIDNDRRITGYTGNVSITITSKDTAQVSNIVQEATKAGANTINGTSFSVDDPNKYREEARNAAIANAKEQAQKIAKNLGIKLGKVTNIVESSPADGAVPMYDRAMMSAVGNGGGAEFQAGSQTIVSTVTLYFEKK